MPIPMEAVRVGGQVSRRADRRPWGGGAYMTAKIQDQNLPSGMHHEMLASIIAAREKILAISQPPSNTRGFSVALRRRQFVLFQPKIKRGIFIKPKRESKKRCVIWI